MLGKRIPHPPISGKNIIQEMSTYYSEQAPWHDEYVSYTSNKEMEKLLKPIIDDFEKYIVNQNVLEIACGTGNWTQVLARRADSILATDINESVLQIALTKKYENDNVTFRAVDAYDLEKIDSDFGVAFAADWWSHVPKSMIPAFIESLHNRLCREAKVIIVDMYPKSADLVECYNDEEGNLIGKRKLPNGRKFEVIKNFYSEKSLKNIFRDVGVNIEYHSYNDLQRWLFIYKLCK